nr:rod shape-determining protein RodA [Bacteroidales bacterium]
MRNRDTDLVRRLDWFTIFLYIGLVLAGWMNIFAAVYNEDAGNIFDISQKYGKQMLWIVAA